MRRNTEFHFTKLKEWAGEKIYVRETETIFCAKFRVNRHVVQKVRKGRGAGHYILVKKAEEGR